MSRGPETAADVSGSKAVPGSTEAGVSVLLPLEDTADMKSGEFKIREAKSRTENLFLMIAISSFAASLLVVFIALHCMPAHTTAISQIYEKWLTVLGPLLGAAFGVGVTTSARKG